MSLEAQLLALIAPLQPGEEVAAGYVLKGVSTELGLRYRLGGPEGPLNVDVAPLSDGRRHAARSARFGFGYRVEGGRHEVDTSAALRVCQLLAERALANEEAVLAALAEQAEPGGGSRVREVRVDQLLEPSNTGSFYTVSPYVGCLVGCRFCYAQTPLDTVRRLLGLPLVPWGSWVDARVNAAQVLERELAEAPIAPIKFCPIVSDPYQPLEAKLELTRACLTVLRDHPRAFPVLLLTRCRLVERDLDLLASLRELRVGVSLPTVDDAVRRHFEPRAADVATRLALLERLREAGVSTFAVVQPLFPCDVEAHAEALARTVSSVSIDVLQGEEAAGPLFDVDSFQEARTPAWQRRQAEALRRALVSRGVPCWEGELPPDLAARYSRAG